MARPTATAGGPICSTVERPTSIRTNTSRPLRAHAASDARTGPLAHPMLCRRYLLTLGSRKDPSGNREKHSCPIFAYAAPVVLVGRTAPAASGKKSDPSPYETKLRPGLGVAPGRADGAGGMRAAGDLARSHRLAADDVQHLSQDTPRRKVQSWKKPTPQIPHASRQLPRLPAKRRWWGRPGSWSQSRRTWRWSARPRPVLPWPPGGRRPEKANNPNAPRSQSLKTKPENQQLSTLKFPRRHPGAQGPLAPRLWHPVLESPPSFLRRFQVLSMLLEGSARD